MHLAHFEAGTMRKFAVFRVILSWPRATSSLALNVLAPTDFPAAAPISKNFASPLYTLPCIVRPAVPTYRQSTFSTQRARSSLRIFVQIRVRTEQLPWLRFTHGTKPHRGDVAPWKSPIRRVKKPP